MHNVLCFFFFSVFAFVFEKNFEVYLSTFDINNKKTIQSVVKLKKCKRTIQTSWSFKKFYLPTIRLTITRNHQIQARKLQWLLTEILLAIYFKGFKFQVTVLKIML